MLLQPLPAGDSSPRERSPSSATSLPKGSVSAIGAASGATFRAREAFGATVRFTAAAFTAVAAFFARGAFARGFAFIALFRVVARFDVVLLDREAFARDPERVERPRALEETRARVADLEPARFFAAPRARVVAERDLARARADLERVVRPATLRRAADFGRAGRRVPFFADPGRRPFCFRGDIFPSAFFLRQVQSPVGSAVL
jgi:hypothetical protein